MGTSQRNHSLRAQSRLASKDYKHDASYVPQSESDPSQVLDRMLCAEPESLLYLSPSVADVSRPFSSPEMSMDVDIPSAVIDQWFQLNPSLNSDYTDQFNALQPMQLLNMPVQQYQSHYQQPPLQPSYYEPPFMTTHPSFSEASLPFQPEPYMGDIPPTSYSTSMASITSMTNMPSTTTVSTLYPTSMTTEPVLQSRNGRGKKASYSRALPTPMPVYIYPGIQSATSTATTSPVSPTPSCEVVRPRQQARGSKRSRPHTPETRDIFKCDRCPKEFDRRYNYTQHYRTHSPNKDFKCCYDGCNAAFHRKADLQRHQLRHTGELPIKCKFECGANFRRVEAMTRHCKQVHLQEYLAYKHQKEQQRASKNTNARERR